MTEILLLLCIVLCGALAIMWIFAYGPYGLSHDLTIAKNEREFWKEKFGAKDDDLARANGVIAALEARLNHAQNDCDKYEARLSLVAKLATIDQE